MEVWVDRREEVALNRLRLGYTNLKSTLKLIGKHPSCLCEQCQEEETVMHVIMQCRRYEQERQCMREEARRAKVLDILSSPKGLGRILFAFLEHTGLMARQ